MNSSLLGGISPQEFLDKYWQKKPLLVRNAIPDFADLLRHAELQSLARRDDVESRLVYRAGDSWNLVHGPLRKRDIPKTTPWTILVQNLNALLPAADELLRQFRFIPYARLDDLMVSYATHGGGVGPHFDSYDVFLLQGSGQRRWQISAQRDLDLVQDAPLKILKKFKATQEWLLGPGDMLYLPPRYAHNGIAVGDCTTYSIGFRAPTNQELAVEFLNFVQERTEVRGMYADPDLKVSRHPAELPMDMIEKVVDLVGQIKWKRDDVIRFLGAYLSEPKAHVFFDPPEQPLSLTAWRRQVGQAGLTLDLRTQMLYRGRRLFMNGEEVTVAADSKAVLQRLANDRMLRDMHGVSDDVWGLLYEWYECGFLH